MIISRFDLVCEMQGIALDTMMLDDGFTADFSFDPSGKLDVDKINFAALMERIIHGKK